MTKKKFAMGLLGGGFKPFTKGHYNLVLKASAECEEVIVFVSTGDRCRPGEFDVTWDMMKPIWKKYLVPAFKALGNVSVRYVNVPIRGIMDTLVQANMDETDPKRKYAIYSDAEDTKYFKRNSYRAEKQQLYWPELYANKQVVLRSVLREETGGISGTKMRLALERGTLRTFKSGLPAPVKPFAQEIFDLLVGEK